MESKIGDVFFETRAKMSAAVESLARLAGELEVHPSRVSLLKNLIANLREPFLFVVVGEVNAGKSTLLNAIFGEEFCKSDVLPMTDKICLFKQGPESRDIPVSDTFQELYRPNEFLKDFNIVDTPGTNSIVDDHQDITERFVPLADLVIFTFSVTNPWGATAWSLLDKIHKRWHKNLVFVLQQCDLRNEDEISAILEHIRVTALQRLGSQFPIFSLSAKQALLAKTSALDKERLWKESEFAPFENFISETVNSPEVRQNKLGNVSKSARVVLNEAKEKLSAGATILKADEQLLSGLDEDVGEQRSKTVEKFSALYRSLDSEYMELSIAGSAYLQSQLGYSINLRNLFKPARTADTIQERIIDGMITAAEEQVGEATAIIEDDLQHLWRQLAEKMQKHFNFKLRVGTESGEPEWDAQKQHMAEKLVATLRERVAQLELPKLLRPRLIARKWLVGICTFGVAGMLIGGVATLLVGRAPIDQMILQGAIGAAGFLALVIVGAIVSHRNYTGTNNLFGDHLEENRAELGALIKERLGEEVNGFFADFVNLFEPLHQLCEEHRTRYLPQVRELERIQEAFDEIDISLGRSGQKTDRS
ncbi:MAG: dynamin family protein [Verrucomicrobiota bacterium]